MTPRTVIVGASVAGVRTATALRSRGYSGEIVLVDSEAGLPYDKPPLSKGFLVRPDDQGPCALATRAELDDLAITLREGTHATGLRPRDQVVVLSDGELRYTDLVIATGSRPRVLPALAGIAGVHQLRSRGDAMRIAEGLRASRRLAVIGGGFIGAEVAATARGLGLEVTLIEAAPHVASRLMPHEVGLELEELHASHGVVLRLGVAVIGAVGAGRVEAVTLADGTTVAAELAVVGVGTVPVTDWLAGSGLRVEEGVVCDASLRAADRVWAVGDVARWPNGGHDGSVRLEHWTSAREQATYVASRIADGSGLGDRPCTVVPYVWSDQYDVRIQHVGAAPDGSDDVERAATRTGIVFHYWREGALIGATGFNAQAAVLQVRRELGRSVVPQS